MFPHIIKIHINHKNDKEIPKMILPQILKETLLNCDLCQIPHEPKQAANIWKNSRAKNYYIWLWIILVNGLGTYIGLTSNDNYLLKEYEIEKSQNVSCDQNCFIFI